MFRAAVAIVALRSPRVSESPSLPSKATLCCHVHVPSRVVQFSSERLALAALASPALVRQASDANAAALGPVIETLQSRVYGATVEVFS